MTRLAIGTVAVLAIIYVVPIIAYGTLSVVTGLQPPGDSPMLFLVSVLVSKLGTAAAFVLIFHFAKAVFSGRWLLYAGIWWGMFAVGEIGQAIAPDYSWPEAIAGIVSEAIYFPASAWVVDRLLRD